MVSSGGFAQARPGPDIPARYGPHTPLNRFNRWRKGGPLSANFKAASAAYDGDVQTIDSSSIWVHQHAANGQRKLSDPVAWVARGGLTTKSMGWSIPKAVDPPQADEGQAHDGRSAADMFETVETGHILLADRVYDGDALRAAMAERGACATSAQCRTASNPSRSAHGSTVRPPLRTALA